MLITLRIAHLRGSIQTLKRSLKNIREHIVCFSSLVDNWLTFSIFHVGDDLTEEEKRKAVLYVLDRYQVSLKAYHELTQITKDLPRTCTLEEIQKKIGESFDIEAIPGETIGARTSLINELKRDKRLKKYKESDKVTVSPP